MGPAAIPSPNQEAQLELVRRALSKDRRAVSALIGELTPAVQGRVATILLRSGRTGRAEVEDITQDTLVALFAEESASLAQWDPERGLSLRGFAALIAERRSISYLRTRNRDPLARTNERESDEETSDSSRFGTGEGAGTQLGEAASRTEAPVDARTLLAGLAHHLAETLSAQGLEMFYRFYVWDQSVQQIAQETGASVDAIYQWRSRLRRAALDFQASHAKE